MYDIIHKSSYRTYLVQRLGHRALLVLGWIHAVLAGGAFELLFLASPQMSWNLIRRVHRRMEDKGHRRRDVCPDLVLNPADEDPLKILIAHRVLRAAGLRTIAFHITPVAAEGPQFKCCSPPPSNIFLLFPASKS